MRRRCSSGTSPPPPPPESVAPAVDRALPVGSAPAAGAAGAQVPRPPRRSGGHARAAARYRCGHPGDGHARHPARGYAAPADRSGRPVAQEQLPASLASVLHDRLSSVSAQTAQILRTAALLGGKFTVTDLAVLLRRPVSDLAPGLQEAIAARILIGSGAELAFRHQLIRQALHASLPT